MKKKFQQRLLAVCAASAFSLPAFADPSTPTNPNDPGIKAGPVKITFGGFIEAAAIWRDRNETADIGSSFNAIPFKNDANYENDEFRESSRQSRLQLLAQGPADSVNKVEAFYAMDFLSSGTTSNSNESNSYTLRVREAYADWYRKDWDGYILFGQTWSTATMFKQGITPRKENIPLTIDAQYVTGFNWARQAQLRLVRNFGTQAAVALSLEEPQQLISGTAKGSGASTSNPGGSLLNSTATYSSDVAPDVIVKGAFDPGYGHYELYSLTRFFHDRAGNADGSDVRGHTTTAQSWGAAALLPVVPKMLDFQMSGLVGHGNGRYGSSQLKDSVVNPEHGEPNGLMEKQFLFGVIGHPDPLLDVYLYGGVEKIDSDQHGFGAADNSGCDTPIESVATGTTLACSKTIQRVRQLNGGFWYKLYKGQLGFVNSGLQVSYTKMDTFDDANGNEGKTNDTMVFAALRYYPFQ